MLSIVHVEHPAEAPAKHGSQGPTPTIAEPIAVSAVYAHVAHPQIFNSVPGTHGLDTMSQHVYLSSSHLGWNSPMLGEDPQAPIIGGKNVEINVRKGATTIGDLGQCSDDWWSGTLEWVCTATPPLQANVLAIDQIGDLCALSPH
jgi:hypothetical protein